MYTRELRFNNNNSSLPKNKPFTELHKYNDTIQVSFKNLYTTFLSQEDFLNGPFIINKPGVYKLREDIIFHPNIENNGKPTNEQLKTLPIEFNLGFFAAIIINSDDVLLDLNKFSVKQSPLFNIQQTFYANVQIGGTPFIKKQGPGRFPDSFKTPNNVKIQNGTLGLSSHHGIHCATGVNKCIITDLLIENFGVAGIAINGGNSLLLSKIKVDNKNVNIMFNSNLSFAIFMIPHFKTLLDKDKNLKCIIQNKERSVESIYNSLEKEIDKAFLAVKKNMPYDGPFKNVDAPCYDANIYGIVLNSKGVLVNDFKKLNLDQKENNSDIVLDNVEILNCKSAGTEIIAVTNDIIKKEKSKYGSGVIKGVQGDIFDLEKSTNKDGTFALNFISECQICLAKHKELLNHNTSNIPDIIVKWAENPRINIFDYINKKQLYVIRGRDSMAHIMKGNVGLFISQGNNIVINKVKIDNIKNHARKSKMFGYDEAFKKLASCYGALISGSIDIHFKNTEIGLIESFEGDTENICFKEDCLNFDITKN